MILSLDTSTKSTGYAIFENDEYISSDFIEKKNKDTYTRMSEMIISIYNLIDLLQPDCIVIELTVCPRNVEAQRNLTMILGSIFGKCIEKNITFETLRPTEWRSLVKDKNEKLPRKRDELKKWSLCKVNKLFGIDNIKDDISDAILIGLAYINRLKKGEKK